MKISLFVKSSLFLFFFNTFSHKPIDEILYFLLLLKRDPILANKILEGCSLSQEETKKLNNLGINPESISKLLNNSYKVSKTGNLVLTSKL